MSLDSGGASSARYFFHLCKGEEVIQDEIGVEVSGLEQVRDAFVQIIGEMQLELDLFELDQWEVRVVDTPGIVLARFRLGELAGLRY